VNHLRTHGEKPYEIAVIHGGPGAFGEMQPVASYLASEYGVLEPFQTEASLEKQVTELRNIIEENMEEPIIMIGFSWGAWLSYIFAACFPTLVRKLILVGSGPYKQEYVQQIEQTRLSRLTPEERQEYRLISEKLSDPGFRDKNRLFLRLGELALKTDSYDPLKDEYDKPEIGKVKGYDYSCALNEVLELRRKDKLIRYAKQIRCPVTAIHGDYDPHPAEGVEKPLSNAIKDFQFYLLTECGHKPWIERTTKDRFYQILIDVIRDDTGPACRTHDVAEF
jgi:pimeloyl-ACP methyl ester carboxylesterase